MTDLDIDRNPALVLKEIETSRGNLREYGKGYSIDRRKLAAAEVEYERTMAREVLSLFADYERDGKRPPGEELRRMVGHAKMEKSIWQDYLFAKANVDALDRLIKVESAILSALQSELGQMRDELKFAG